MLTAQEVTIGFDGAPLQPPGTHFAMAQYDEAGYHFQPLGPLATTPPYRMGRVGPNTTGRPNNGTAHLSLLYGDSCKVTRPDGKPFDVLRVDLAEYSTVFSTPQTTVFTGRKADQTTVTVSFTTDGFIDGTNPGVDFQTFTFPDTFRDLVSLETSNILAYDNLVLRTDAATITRRFTADASLSITLRSETVPTSSTSTVLSVPSVTQIGNAELLAFLVREGVIMTTADWRLICSYDGYLVSNSPGALHFEVVNKAGQRINVDDYLAIEAIAQVQRLNLVNGTATRAPEGEMSENRFCKLTLTGLLEDPVTLYGRVPFVFTVGSKKLDQFAKARPTVGSFNGHSGSFTLANAKLTLGQFTRAD